MLLVTSNIDQKLFSGLSIAKAGVRKLDLDCDPRTFDNEVSSGAPACVRWAHLLGSNIVESCAQQDVEQILDVVLVFHIQGLAIGVTMSKLDNRCVETRQDLFDDTERVRSRFTIVARSLRGLLLGKNLFGIFLYLFLQVAKVSDIRCDLI